MRILFALVTTIVISACSSIQNYNAPKHQVGQTFQNSFVIGVSNTSIPLPEGEWTLIGYHQSRNDIGTKINNAVLTQIKEGQEYRFIEVSAPDRHHDWGYAPSKFCDRDDVIHIVSRSNNDGGKQDCWGINHWRMTISDNARGDWKQAREYYRTNNIKIPINGLVVIYNKATNKKFIQVAYGFNPEMEGFSPPVYAEWDVSDWHKDRYYTDKKKVAYIQTIKDWGKSWESKVESGFAGQIHQEVNQTADANYDKVTSKLNQLKKLLADEVITQDDYEQKKQELLDGL